MDNMVIVIFGKVPQQRLTDELLQFEDLNVGHWSQASFPPHQPFSNYCEELTVPILTQVEFPSHDEEEGIVAVSWQLGDVMDNKYTFAAFPLLLKFLEWEILFELRHRECK